MLFLGFRYVLLATDDSPARVAQFIQSIDPYLIVLTIPRIGWWDTSELYEKPSSYGQIIEHVLPHLGNPALVRDVAKQSILELYLLSKCQAFVGAAFSNFLRVAFLVGSTLRPFQLARHLLLRPATDEPPSYRRSITLIFLGVSILSVHRLLTM